MKTRYCAVVHDPDDGTLLYDRCESWEAAQSYAQQGYTVTAIDSDGHLTKEEIQAICDTENRWWADCFGKTI